MARKLKVFCTPIGFHDAYVAAPSQKAALEAWGTDANLFARGMASVVTDPKLTMEPLARPGQVIKHARGTADEHLAALPKSKARSTRAAPELLTTGKKIKPKPKPSRRKLNAAERALERAGKMYDTAAEAIRRREEKLRRERHDLTAKRDAEIARLQRGLDEVRADYDHDMDAWRDSS
ncbi:MAG: hypothetical protein JSR79_14500 [Proteobacteria bacterium]|nr:hypothetical protein [Pseudomonadota bacterium]